MTSKEDDFKQRFVAVMQDLREDGSRDAEAVWLLGSLAATLVDTAKARSWPALKQQLSRADYDRLLRDFQTSGNSFHKEGKRKHAYAVQVLAMSVVARTQQDPDIQAGNTLLDDIVERAIAHYRRSRAPQTVTRRG
ncbi:MAG TPA: hypothetical protein VGN80_03240 [Devosiaceae bacterium]|jgi:hypothetical protein|nr:hypothetical protein [Devosiaceae bacterium]